MIHWPPTLFAQNRFGAWSILRYNENMPLQPSKSLYEGCHWLKDDRVRNERIFDVVERNSIIEGLPPLSQAFRNRLDRRYRSNQKTSAKRRG